MTTEQQQQQQQPTPISLEEAERHLAEALRLKEEAAEAVREEARLHGGIIPKGSVASQKQSEAARRYREAEREFWEAYKREKGADFSKPQQPSPPQQQQQEKQEQPTTAEIPDLAGAEISLIHYQVENILNDILDPLERKVLTNLKGYASMHVSEEAARHPNLGGEVPRRSDAAKIESAFGKYAYAIALRHGLTVQQVMQMVPNEIDVSEPELVNLLREECARKTAEERVASNNMLRRGGMAAHVQSALDKFESALSHEFTTPHQEDDVFHPIERTILQNLKAYESQEYRLHSRLEGYIPKNSDATLPASAFAMYAQAVAIRHGMSQQDVSQRVPNGPLTLSDTELLNLLAQDLVWKQDEERRNPERWPGMGMYVQAALTNFELYVNHKRTLDSIEWTILTNLKARESIESMMNNIGGQIPKGSDASNLESAFGHYSQSLALRHGLKVQDVMHIVPPIVDTTDSDLMRMLRADVKRKEEEERKVSGGMVAKGGVTAQAQAALDKLLLVLGHKLVSPTGNTILDTLTPMERKILQNLKGYESQRHALESKVQGLGGGEVVSGSDTSHLTTSFGKYAHAVALAHNLRVQDVMHLISPSIDVSELDLVRMLKQDAAQKMEDERVGRGQEGVGAQAQAAADTLESVFRVEGVESVAVAVEE